MTLSLRMFYLCGTDTNRKASSNQRVIFEETEGCLQGVLICGHWIRHSSANGCPLYIVYYYEVL